MLIKNEERYLQGEENGISCVASAILRSFVRNGQRFLTNENNKERVSSFTVQVNGKWQGREARRQRPLKRLLTSL